MNVTILGLGAMGSRMAQRLAAAGQTVTVCNRTAGRAARLSELGVEVAATPRQAAEGADIVIAMLSDDDASRAVWTDPETGALAGLASGAIAIESSTLTPGWVRDLFGLVDERGATFLDAPVAGSRPQAEAGQLIYLVGGDDETLARARPVLEAMGGAIHHVGPVSHGAVLKLAVNALFGIQAAALGELIGFLEASGLDAAKAIGLLGDTPVMSPAARGIAGLMLAGSFAPMFPIDLVAKDFRYAVAAASAAGADLPLAGSTEEVFRAAVKRGLGGDNIAGVVRLYLNGRD